MYQMRIEFDDGTLVLHDAPETVPYAEWDDRADEYRAQAYLDLALTPALQIEPRD